MPENRSLIALIAVSFIAVLFASLFGWQYVKAQENDSIPAISTGDDVDDAGCPFYPVPQELDVTKNPQFNKLFAWMDTYLNSTLDPNVRPSLSANLIYRDKIIWKGNFGNISKTVQQPPTENTIYRIASISKTFPVLFLFKLWEDGKVNLYDPVTKYAPDFTLQPEMGSTDEINLIDLASQISGMAGALPFNPFSGSAIIFNGQLEDALALLEDQVLSAEPRSECIYSNLAYALLGDILARNFSGRNFTDWAQKNIVDVLGLTNTGFHYSQDVINKMATGYMNTGRPASIYDLGWYGPAGNYYSTSADLAKFAMSFLETSKTILKHETITEMLRPRKSCKHGYVGGLATLTGSPWEINTIDENLIVRKDGDLEGYSSTMALVPDMKIAFNVLMSGTRSENIARKVLEQVIPVFRDTLRGLNQNVDPTPDPEKYVGNYTYYNLQSQSIVVSANNELLMENFQAPSGRYNTTGLSYVKEGIFRLRILGGEYPCIPNLESQDGSIVHFRDFENGMYNTFDFPELSVYGFKRK